MDSPPPFFPAPESPPFHPITVISDGPRQAHGGELLMCLERLRQMAWEDIEEYDDSRTFATEVEELALRVAAPSTVQETLREAAKLLSKRNGILEVTASPQRLIGNFFDDVFRRNLGDGQTARNRAAALRGLEPEVFVFVAFAYEFAGLLRMNRHCFAYVIEKTGGYLASRKLPKRWFLADPIRDVLAYEENDDDDEARVFRQKYRDLDAALQVIPDLENNDEESPQSPVPSSEPEAPAEENDEESPQSPLPSSEPNAPIQNNEEEGPRSPLPLPLPQVPVENNDEEQPLRAPPPFWEPDYPTEENDEEPPQLPLPLPLPEPPAENNDEELPQPPPPSPEPLVVKYTDEESEPEYPDEESEEQDEEMNDEEYWRRLEEPWPASPRSSSSVPEPLSPPEPSSSPLHSSDPEYVVSSDGSKTADDF